MPIDIENDSLETAIKKLKAKEDTYAKLEAISNFGSWEVNLKTNQSRWSDQSYKIYGLDKETTQPTLQLFLSHVHEDDLAEVRQKIQKGIATGEVTSVVCKIRKANGEIANILISGQVLYDENGIADKLIGTTQDISEQISIKQHSHELSKLIEFSSSEIYIVQYDTLKYLYVNRGACHALGYTQEELLNKTVLDINPNLTQQDVEEQKKIVLEHEQLINRSLHKRKDGSLYDVQAYIHMLDYQGQKAFVIFDIDITELVEAEKLLHEQNKRLNHQANHDTLTKLPNRMLFQDRLSEIIKSSTRNQEQFALLFIDLDQFKTINDSLGHNIGDEVLIQTAQRLQSVLRTEDTLARLGGDEFAIIFENIKKEEEIIPIIEKILILLKQDIRIDHVKINISGSIGLSVYPKNGKNIDTLVKCADTALYHCKNTGKNKFCFCEI